MHMRANPGGAIAPDEVLGRDRLIARLWQILERQSVLLVAERRMGKSSVIKKMHAEVPEGRLSVFRDVENISSPLEFVERVYEDVSAHLSRLDRSASHVRSFLKQVAGFELGGIIKFPEAAAPHWKMLLERTLKDLVEGHSESIVLFWDELPLMLQNIARVSGEEVAMEILDSLRHARQMNPSLRMVYSGSIGLHHVTQALREAGHTNDATNDMLVVEVPPLAPRDAASLAAALLKGERLECEDIEATAVSIAGGVDGVPFYIHHVVSKLKDRGDRASVSLAEEVIAEALVDAQDPWHLHYYRKRIPSYYGKERDGVVLLALDEVSVSDPALGFTELIARLNLRVANDPSALAVSIRDYEEEPLRDLLLLLMRDHYLRQRPADGKYSFRFPLIARWWRIHRGLL